MGAGDQGYLKVRCDMGQSLILPFIGEVVGDGNAGGCKPGNIFIDIAVAVGIDQVEGPDIIQILLGEGEGMFLGNASPVRTQKYTISID